MKIVYVTNIRHCNKSFITSGPGLQGVIVIFPGSYSLIFFGIQIQPESCNTYVIWASGLSLQNKIFVLYL